MKFNIKPLSYEDYDNILIGWWKKWGWKPPVRSFLPQNGEGGIMIWDKEIPVCAGFIYTTNSKVVWIDWIISNKEYKKKPERDEAIKLLLEELERVSRGLGYKFGYALLKHPKLISTYEDLGFIKGESYTHEMIKYFK